MVVRTELMTEAMCWELAENVTAEYACANKDLSYFCPHRDCLQEVVSPSPIKNWHFRAPGKHAPGCPNTPPEVENKDTTTSPATKVSIVPPAPIPTELGPAKKGIRNKSKPTRDKLLALADSLKSKPPCCAGTLLEVVDAWHIIPSVERRNRRLHVNGQELTYQTAFFCLSELGGKPIKELPCETKIVHGLASIEVKEDCYWIKPIKKIFVGTAKIGMVMRIPRDASEAAQYVEDFLKSFSGYHSYSLFYFGDLPTISTSGKNFVLNSNASDKYRRFVLRASS